MRVSRPLLVDQQPAQQHAENFVRIHKAAIFGNRADAVSIAIGGQSRVAFFFYDRFLQHRDVRLNRLRIDTRKQRIHLLPDRNKRNATLLKDPRKNSASRTIHRVDGELEPGFADQIHVGKAADRGDIRRLQISFFDGRLRAFRHRANAHLFFNFFHDGGRGRPAELPFELHPIPVPGIVA
jgi:hypothetical protein